MGRERHLLRTAVGIGAEDPPQWTALLERWRVDQENNNVYHPVAPLEQVTLSQLYDARGHPINDAVRKSNDEQADAANACTIIARKHNVVVGNSPSRGADDESISSGSIGTPFHLDDASEVLVYPEQRTTVFLSKYYPVIGLALDGLRGALKNWNEALRLRVLACPSYYANSSFVDDCVRDYKRWAPAPFFLAGISTQFPMRKLHSILSMHLQSWFSDSDTSSWISIELLELLAKTYGFLCWNWSVVQRLFLVPYNVYFPRPGLKFSDTSRIWMVPHLTLNNYVFPFDALAITALTYTLTEISREVLVLALSISLASSERASQPLVLLQNQVSELKKYLAPLNFSNSLRSWGEIQVHRFNHLCYSVVSILGWEGRMKWRYKRLTEPMRFLWRPSITLADLMAEFMTSFAFRKVTTYAVRYLAKAFLRENILDLSESSRELANSIGSTAPVLLGRLSTFDRTYRLSYWSKIGLAFGIEAATDLLWWTTIAAINTELGRRYFGWQRNAVSPASERRGSSPEPMDMD